MKINNDNITPRDLLEEADLILVAERSGAGRL
jgi:hypothetical protein